MFENVLTNHIKPTNWKTWLERLALICNICRWHLSDVMNKNLLTNRMNSKHVCRQISMTLLTASSVLQTLYPNSWPLTTLTQSTVSQARVTHRSPLTSHSKSSLPPKPICGVSRCGLQLQQQLHVTVRVHSSCFTAVCFCSPSLYSCTQRLTLYCRQQIC